MQRVDVEIHLIHVGSAVVLRDSSQSILQLLLYFCLFLFCSHSLICCSRTFSSGSRPVRLSLVEENREEDGRILGGSNLFQVWNLLYLLVGAVDVDFYYYLLFHGEWGYLTFLFLFLLAFADVDEDGC